MKKKRSTLLVDPNFQILFLSAVGGLVLLVVGVLFGANAYFFSKFYTLAKGLLLPQDHLLYQFLNYQKDFMLKLTIGLTAGVALLLGTFGLAFSHWIAGPIFRFRLHLLNDARRGKPTPLAFRKRDFFKELPVAYNDLVAAQSGQNQRRSEPRLRKVS